MSVLGIRVAGAAQGPPSYNTDPTRADQLGSLQHVGYSVNSLKG